jgi:hypothetical protein
LDIKKLMLDMAKAARDAGRVVAKLPTDTNKTYYKR